MLRSSGPRGLLRILRLTGGLAAVAALWWLGWMVAASFAAHRLELWIAAEAADGRQWTCPGRTLEGFPFALRLHCARPTFRGEVAGHSAVGVLEGLTAEVGLARPGVLAVGLGGPLNLRAEDDAFAVELSWAALSIAVPGLPGTPAGGSTTADRLAVSVSAPPEGDVNIRVAHLEGEAGPAETAGPDRRFAFTAEGVGFPTLDPIPGLEAPADAAGRGVLHGATLLSAPTVGRLEAWRGAGGRLDLAAFSLTKGPFSGEAHGTLALDDAHRPAGALKTRLAGFGPIAQRFGIPTAGVQLGGLLSTLLSGGKAPAPGGDRIAVPLTLAEGRLSVGPITTGVRLRPLY